MTTAKPPARYSAMESARSGDFATRGVTPPLGTRPLDNQKINSPANRREIDASVASSEVPDVDSHRAAGRRSFGQRRQCGTTSTCGTGWNTSAEALLREAFLERIIGDAGYQRRKMEGRRCEDLDFGTQRSSGAATGTALRALRPL